MFRQVVVFGGLLVVAVACSSSPPESQSDPTGSVVIYEGAHLIPGDGSPPIDGSSFLVEDGTITWIGEVGELTGPAEAGRVDLTGKTVMPTLIDAHVHPGFQKGLTFSGDNFSRETVIDDLNRALYFGVGAVLSQGIEKGELTYQLRAEQEAGVLGGARLRIAGRGIGAPNAGPGGTVFQGIVYEITSEEEARQSVKELVSRNVDVIKIWVDDRNGRAPSLSPPIYRAVIDEGHKLGMRVNAHVFYHADAVDLVEAGIDGFVHLVRDKEMDDALVASIVKRNVYVMSNLSGSQRATYAELPPWLRDDDPLLRLVQDTVSSGVVRRMKDSFSGRDSEAVASRRERYTILQRSLAKLNAAGARLVLGADTGLSDHHFGLATQRELAAMVEAGMTPAQGIAAATSRAAEYLGLDTMGSLVPGKSADFLVLEANPLDDITHTRRITRIYVKGVEVDRAALRAAWTSAATE